MMSTSNLDAVGHRWVASLAGFNFTIEYLRGADNEVADLLSRVGNRLELDTDSVHELLSHSNNPTVLRAETDNPRLMQEHARQEQEIIMQAYMLKDSHVALCNLADSHWIIAQQSEPVIQLTTQWLKHPKDNHSTLAEFLRGQVPDQIQHQYATRQKYFTLSRGLLYLKTMPSHSNEDVLAFMVPTHKRQAAIDGCHRYTGHQGRDHTLSLIKEQFWWPEMVQETV